MIFQCAMSCTQGSGKSCGLFISYTEKSARQRFVQMASKNAWWQVLFRLAIYHLLKNSSLTKFQPDHNSMMALRKFHNKGIR